MVGGCFVKYLTYSFLPCNCDGPWNLFTMQCVTGVISNVWLKRGREHAATELSNGNSHTSGVLEEFPDGFVQWVTKGEALGH